MIHCGFLGIVGLPNAGKSTFLNHVLGEKISIVSNKPQTTRQSFTGLVSNEEYQLIFLDAPGYVEAKPGLFSFLNEEFKRTLEKAEHLLVLVANDQKESSAFTNFYKHIKESGKPYSLLVTKADLAPSDFVKSLVADTEKLGGLCSFFSIKKGGDKEVSAYLKHIATSMPTEHHPLYDPDMISLDRTRDIVAEFIREQCFVQLSQEIPYGLGVIIKSFKKVKGLQHIEANIVIEKENHKAIVIGKGGAQLKKIGQGARAKIEELLGEKVFLGLHVAHKKNWQRSKAIMKELGYHHEPK